MVSLWRQAFSNSWFAKLEQVIVEKSRMPMSLETVDSLLCLLMWSLCLGRYIYTHRCSPRRTTEQKTGLVLGVLTDLPIFNDV